MTHVQEGHRRSRPFAPWRVRDGQGPEKMEELRTVAPCPDKDLMGSK